MSRTKSLKQKTYDEIVLENNTPTVEKIDWDKKIDVKELVNSYLKDKYYTFKMQLKYKGYIELTKSEIYELLIKYGHHRNKNGTKRFSYNLFVSGIITLKDTWTNKYYFVAIS
jgi:hypothetical protein